MSLEGVYDVPMYSAPTELDDLWSHLDGCSWNGAAQQNHFLSQAPQWQLQPQPTQQMFGWPAAGAGPGPSQDYGAMPLMPEDATSSWDPANGFIMPTAPVPGDRPQNAQTVLQMKSPALPVNHNYSSSLPVHHNNAATSAVPPTSATWAVGSSQPLANPSWHQQTHHFPGVMPVQACQNNANPTNNNSRPHFNITITPNRIIRKVAKRKRVRTAFTTDQILALEKVFSRQTYVNKDERQVLTEKLNISDRAIKVWFQNRRMKGKRESQAAECSDECEPESTEPELTEARPEPSTSNDSYGSPSSELDYIEAHIQKPNDRGFVTLNEEALDCLCNAIDTYVPEAIELVRKETVPKNEIIYLYEPISPADTTSSAAEEIEKYEPPVDEEGRQKLFDRHFC